MELLKKDRITNERVTENLGVTPINENIREHWLRWYGHIQWLSVDAPVRRKIICIKGKSERGRPKLTWEETIKNDYMELNLTKDMAQNRDK